MLTISALIAAYGYYALFIGTFLEGETVLVAAGFAAHRGMLQMPWVIAIAFVASTLGDQTAFFLGRQYGNALIERFPSLRSRVLKVRTLLSHYYAPLILMVRFLYGLRIAGPMVIGMSEVSVLKFAMLNMAGALLWSVSIASVGYYFGEILELLSVDLKYFEGAILICIITVGIGCWLWRLLRTV